MDVEWRPDEDGDPTDMELHQINNLTEDDLRKLGSQIGIQFHNPQPRKRSRRHRKKTKQYVPVEKLRDWRGLGRALREKKNQRN